MIIEVVVLGGLGWVLMHGGEESIAVYLFVPCVAILAAMFHGMPIILDEILGAVGAFVLAVMYDAVRRKN